MRIKRFRAPDMRTALELVRAEMGRDAVILQSRAVRGRGLLGWLGRGRRWVEVTAAWDGDGPRAGLSAGWDRAAAAGFGAGRPAAGGVGRPPNVAAGGDAGGWDEPAAAVQSGEGGDRGRGGAAGAPPARPAAAGAPAAVAAPSPQGALPAALPDGRARRLDVTVGEGPLLPSPAAAGRAAGPHGQAPAPAGTRAASPVLPPPAPPLAGTVVVVGPTGAGKTTVVANLAARAVLDEGREVALLAADTYRLGATRALASYAELLGLPLEVAYAPGEVAAWANRQGEHGGAAEGEQADAQVAGGEGGVRALVDTAGRNLLLPEVAAELAAVVAAARPDRVLLVVPATLAPAEAAAVVAAGRRLGATDLVLTKLDECLDPAAALARAAGWGLPLARVGLGQRVPEDLVPGTPEALGPWLAHARRRHRGGGGLHGHDADRVG